MKNRRLKSCLFAVGIFAVGFFLIPLFLRVGYCQSWWGRDNLIFRSLWLCACSKEFEQSLYPENVEVLASACDCAEGRYSGTAKPRLYFEPLPALVYQTCEASPGVHRVPGSQFVQVGNQLIDLYTGDATPFFLPSGTGIAPRAWVTDNLIWVLDRGEHYLYRLADQAGLRVPNIWVIEHGRVDISSMVEKLKQANQILVVEYASGTDTIVLGQDYWNHPEDNFFFKDDTVPGEYREDMAEKFLADMGLSYQYIGQKDAAISPSGQWIAKSDGIYNLESEEKVFDFGVSLPQSYPYGLFDTNVSINFQPITWREDEQAIVLAAGFYVNTGDLDRKINPPYIPLFALPYLDDGAMTGILFSVPQPVLMVNIPEETIHQSPQK